jgi:hypothetical protein
VVTVQYSNPLEYGQTIESDLSHELRGFLIPRMAAPQLLVSMFSSLSIAKLLSYLRAGKWAADVVTIAYLANRMIFLVKPATFAGLPFEDYVFFSFLDFSFT